MREALTGAPSCRPPVGVCTEPWCTSERAPPSLSLGATAPDFSLADPGGRTWTLADAGGPRGTLVAFVCNHCPYVKHVAVALGEAAARWADAGVATVAINSNDAKSHPDDRPERMVEQARAWGGRSRTWSTPTRSSPATIWRRAPRTSSCSTPPGRSCTAGASMGPHPETASPSPVTSSTPPSPP